MAGLYIHIPFCKSRCIYCAFYSTTLLTQRQQYVEALCTEIATSDERRAAGTDISTIYLGGGTPSQLTTTQLQQVFEAIYQHFNVIADAEITIEANPDDVTEEWAKGLALLPVNRVSMGAQTFDDKRLRWLHRRHTARQVAMAVERLRQCGISNISIDLMYGFPAETLQDWERDIDAALALNVEHLSAYCLMVEEGSELFRRIETGAERFELSEETERKMYERLIDRLTEGGYEHYEISNFARKGYRSRHNSSYWNDTPYIGIGAAAHSYDGRRRMWNVADLSEYIRRTQEGLSATEDSEEITGWTRYNDRVTVALRTREGLDLRQLTEEERQYCKTTARRFLDDGLLQLEDHHLHLTRRGLFVSDMVMSELMNV